MNILGHQVLLILFLKVTYFWFIAAFFIEKCHQKCSPVISEINGDKISNQNKNSFVELEFFCNNDADIPSATGYKLIIINGNRGIPEFEFYASLANFPDGENVERRFYTIGDDLLNPKPTLALSNNRVSTK